LQLLKFIDHLNYTTMINLNEINNLWSYNEKITHLVKHIEEMKGILKQQDETITALMATNDKIMKSIDAQAAHLSSHDQHLQSHDQHLSTHDGQLASGK